jgi:hypothetical protein
VNAVRLSADGDSDAAQDMIQQGLARYPQSEDLRYLDDLLAEETRRDQWKLDAVSLQVQWRCEDSSARRQRTDEALALIDQAISAQPAMVLYASRVQCALAASRPDVVVESVWEYGEDLFSDSSLEPAQVRDVLQQLLQVLSRQSGADRTRLQEVRQRLQQDVQDLGNR